MHRIALVLILVAACKSKTETKPEATPAGSAAGSGSAAPLPKQDAPVVDLAGFAKDCKEATDCVLVKRAGCDPCACAVDAIASKEMAKFDEASDKLACPPIDLDRQMACGGCNKNTATCTDGQCVMAAPAAP